MILKRLAEDRTFIDVKWLKSWATFTYSPYIGPELNSYHDLLKLEDEILAPGGGFDRHPHSHTEMFHYIISGEIVHHNDGGGENILKAGDIQCVSARSGIVHSTKNPSPDQDAHFLQFWIYPKRHLQDPTIEVIHVPPMEKFNRFRLIASPDGVDGSLKVLQETQIHIALIEKNIVLPFSLGPGKKAFLYIVDGSADLNGVDLKKGDSAVVEDESMLRVKGTSEIAADVILWSIR